MKNIIYITFLIIQFFSILYGQSLQDQFEKRSHSAYNKTIPYRLFIPEDYSSMENYPLILYLHSAYPRGDDNNKQLLELLGATTWAEKEVQQENPSFLLIPQCPIEHIWWTQFDILHHLLISLMEEFSIDSTHLYVSGPSMGGRGIWILIPMTPIHFAAAIPVAGDGPDEVMPLVSYLPSIWNFHGVNDNVVDVQGSRDMIHACEDLLGIEAVYPELKNGVASEFTEEQLDSALQAGAQLLYTETSDDHGTISESAYNNPKLSNWMFSQKTDFSLPVKLPSPTTEESSILSHVTTSSVLWLGEPGSWDDWAVTEPFVIKEGDTLKMWYVGWEAGWGKPTHVGYAWSLDGIDWFRYFDNPVFTADLAWEGVRINQVSVIKDNDIYRMWYSIGDSLSFSTAIGYAWSEDGLKWTKYPDAVLLPGALGEWDHFNIAVGTVIKEDDIYKLWYHGGTYWTGMRIGYATSPDGIIWTKYNDPQTEDMPYHISDPVVSGGRFVKDWDFHGVWYPIVYSGPQGYKMWYSGSTMGCVGFLHYATSSDGINWYKSKSNPVLSHPPEWLEETGYFGGSVLKYEDEYHLWYSSYHYQSGRSAIGYAKDFSNIAHSDSFTIDQTFRRAGLDSLNVNAWVKNPSGHDLELKAHFISVDSLIDHYLPLSNEGNNSWSGQWPVPEGERIYKVGIQTIDLDSGTVHNSVEAISKRFTTIGPIEFDHFEFTSTDTVPNAGDQIIIKVFLRNDGSAETASNITAKLTSLDTGVTVRTIPHLPSYVEYGDIGAGEISESEANYVISFKGPFDKNVYQVPFAIDIRSGDYSFWIYDTSFSIYVGIEQQKEKPIPKDFSLSQNYPNPFNPNTNIEFDMPKTCEVTLKVFNILGEEVATLVSDKLTAGSYTYEWDASNLASGIYLYRLESGEYIETRKMIFMK